MEILNNLLYLVCIATVFAMLLYIKTLYDNRKFSLFYSVYRKIIGKEKTGYEWFMHNKLYLYLFMCGVGLVMIILGFLVKIANHSFTLEVNFPLYIGVTITCAFIPLIFSQLLKRQHNE